MTVPVVTIITPAYNVAGYIDEAIGSVLAQEFDDFEYIVVDDGSTDSTAAVAERRAAVDPRMRVERCDHKGSGAARNHGLKLARGHYVAFLDGDDRWHPRFLERQVAALESLAQDVAAVFCRSRVISESGRPYLVRWQRAGRYDFDDMLVGACPPRCGSSVLLRREAFDQAGVFSVTLRSAVDLDMWLRIQRDSQFPYFWGTSLYLIDLRVRAGAVSRHLSTRFEQLQLLLDTYAGSMRRTPRGGAYARPAVFAYRAGEEDVANRWSAIARGAGMWWLVTDGYGRRVLAWWALGRRNRSGLRRVNGWLRRLAGAVVGAGGALQR